MKKNLLIGFLLVVVLLQLGYTASKTILNNPSLMHMRRREFIAAGIAQGLSASGRTNWKTPEVFADEVMEYTNALMARIDKEDK